MNNAPEQDQSLMATLMKERVNQWVSQTTLAERMKTNQPALACMENGHREPRLSTLERYAACLGKRIVYQLEDL